jgi:putative membrane protein insertion efficiency factor
MKYFFIFLIKIYQIALSPFYPLRCRFKPTCSEYMVQAIRKYGIFKGFWLGAKRIGRCRPNCKGGYDPLE